MRKEQPIGTPETNNSDDELLDVEKINQLKESEDAIERAVEEVEREAGILVEKLEAADINPTYTPPQQNGILTRLGASRLSGKLRVLVLGLSLIGSAEALAKTPNKPVVTEQKYDKTAEEVPHIKYEFGPFYAGEEKARRRDALSRRLSNNFYSINAQEQLLEEYRTKYGKDPNFPEFERDVRRIIAKRKATYETSVQAVKQATTRDGAPGEYDLEYRTREHTIKHGRIAMDILLEEAGMVAQ